MTTAQIIAAILGPIYVAAGVGMLVGTERYRRIVEAFFNGPALAYLGGVIAMALGLLFILLLRWTAPLNIVLSIIGWLAAIKGAMLIVCPEVAARIWTPVLKSAAAFRASAAVALLLGLYLSWAAFLAG